MQSISRRSSTQHPFEMASETLASATTTSKHYKQSPVTDPTFSLLPRTSSIDVGWDSLEHEEVTTPADSEVPESGVRQSDTAIDNQTLRPGIVPVFTQNVQIFESYPKANTRTHPIRPFARRILELSIVFSIGIACGISLHANVIPLMPRPMVRTERTRSFQSDLLPANTKSPNSFDASNRHTRAPFHQEILDNSSIERTPPPSRAADEPNAIKSVEAPINPVGNSGIKAAVPLANPHVGTAAKSQNVAIQRRPVTRRSKTVASDNPY
jgi:hypothetical protein